MIDRAMARSLFDARRNRAVVDFPSSGMTVDEALALQLEVAQLFIDEQRDDIAGWKIGFTSGRSRDRLGSDVRPFGYVLASRCFRSGDADRFRATPKLGIEPELAVILGSDLGGSSVDALAARKAARGVAAAFELNEYRVVAGIANAPDILIADGLNNLGIVIGEEIPADQFNLDGTAVKFSRNSERAVTVAAGRDVLIDDPFVSISRLCRGLAAHGRELHAGNVVITGSFAAKEVVEPSSWRAEFASIGQVSFDFV